MSDSIEYDVSAVLKVKDAGYQAGMKGAADRAQMLQSALDRVTGGARMAMGGVGDIASRVAGSLTAVTLAATTALTAATGVGVMHVGKNLSMLEDKSIQLTAVVAAATEQQFSAVRGQTAELFREFRGDAVRSAGETQDFIDTASKLAGPLLGAGKSMQDLRKITQGVIATAPALGVKFEQAGSDVMRMLQGGAGADLPFFKALQSIPSLGVQSAEAFNKLAIDKRIEIVRKALTNPAFLAASDAAGDTFSGLASTTQDLVKTMGGLAMSPAFEVAKRGMKSITSELVESLDEGGPVRVSLNRLGGTIGYRFGLIGQQIGRMFPNLTVSIWDSVDAVNALVDRGLARVVNGVAWVADRWPQITSAAASFAGHVQHAAEQAVTLVRALGGGDLAKGMERAALLYGGSKMAAPLGSTALGVAQMGQGAVGLGKWAAGAFGGTGAAAGATATAAAAQAGASAGAAASAPAAWAAAEAKALAWMAAEGGGATGAAGAAGTGVAAGGALATGGLLAGAAAFVATIYLAIEQDTFGFVSVLRKHWDLLVEKGDSLQRNLSGLWGQLGQLGDAAVKVYEAIKPLLGVFASLYALPLAAAFEGLLGVLSTTADVVNVLAKNLQGVASAATEASIKMAEFLDKIVDKLGLKRPKLAGVEDEERREGFGAAMIGNLLPSGATLGVGAGGPSPRAKPASGGAGKVEVTLKWDLGEGNEEAIYIRSGKDIREMVKNAKGFVRSGPMPGRF